jgi:hypothetical protein
MSKRPALPEMGGFFFWQCPACQTILTLQEADAKTMDGAMTFKEINEVTRQGLCHCNRVVLLDDLSIRKQSTIPRRM